jgi:hypothetical protein
MPLAHRFPARGFFRWFSWLAFDCGQQSALLAAAAIVVINHFNLLFLSIVF